MTHSSCATGKMRNDMRNGFTVRNGSGNSILEDSEAKNLDAKRITVKGGE